PNRGVPVPREVDARRGAPTGRGRRQHARTPRAHVDDLSPEVLGQPAADHQGRAGGRGTTAVMRLAPRARPARLAVFTVYAAVAAVLLILFFEFVVNRKLLPSNF